MRSRRKKSDSDDDVLMSPTRPVREKAEEIKNVITPSQTIPLKYSESGSPVVLEKKTARKTKLIRSFKAELIDTNENGEESIVEVSVFQTKTSADVRKKNRAKNYN